MEEARKENQLGGENLISNYFHLSLLGSDTNSLPHARDYGTVLLAGGIFIACRKSFL